MRTEAKIRNELAIPAARLEADDWPPESDECPDWVDTSNRVTALKWVLGEGEDEEL